MIKNKIIKKITLFIMPIILLIGYIFNINLIVYYAVFFLGYSIINRMNNRNTFYLVFIWWFLMFFITKDVTLLFSSLFAGIVGDLTGMLLVKNNEIELPNKEIKLPKIVGYIFPIVIFALIEILYFFCNPEQYYSFNISSIIFNIIIVYSIWSIIFGILGSTFKTNTTFTIISILYFIINQLKIYFTGDPISYSDLVLVTQAGEILDIVKNDLLPTMWHYRKLILLLIFNIIFLVKVYKLFDSKKVNLKYRFGLVFGVLIIGFILFPNEGKNNYILKIFFNNTEITKVSALSDYYGAYRMIGGIYDDYLLNIDYSEEIMNKEDLNKIYSTVKEEDNIKEFKKPNIIVMFTEAFWDITKQSTFKFSNDPLKEYHELKDKGILIDTLSPTFGGRSANTEFEFLTGGSLSFFPLGPIGYEKYYQVDEAKNNPSIIQELKNNGYKTEILNASRKTLYGCQNVYEKMEVDKTTHLYNELGYSVKDSYLVDQLIKTFDSKKKDEKLFYMTISMESHMPYKIEDHSHYDFEINSSMNEKYTNIVKAYTQAIRNASLQLKRAYDYIQTLDEDTIIVFYGDHLPILKTYNNNIYDRMGYFNTGNKTNDRYSKYNTETLILSNYDIDYDDIKIASPDIISSIIINNMDIEVSDYYKWLYSTRKVLPSVNSLVAKDLNGKIYDTANLPSYMQTAFNQREKVQKLLFK